MKLLFVPPGPGGTKAFILKNRKTASTVSMGDKARDGIEKQFLFKDMARGGWEKNEDKFFKPISPKGAKGIWSTVFWNRCEECLGNKHPFKEIARGGW